MSPHALVARLDSMGDVLLTGPAVRSVAAKASSVTFLCGPRGRGAAELLPGVDRVVEHLAEWIDPDPPPLDRPRVRGLIDRLSRLDLDEALVFTSFHQSPLPLALILKMAGVRRVAAISDDYPGSLLDVRHRVPDDTHEVERALSLAERAGYRLPPGDDGRLAVSIPPRPAARRLGYVVVHPGASVPARAWAPERYRALAHALASRGHTVVVTGAAHEVGLTRFVAGGPHPNVMDLGGRTGLRELASVIGDADGIVVGNTGPAHLAAAMRTPVVSLFAPTVPAVRWRPWLVPHVLLGDQSAACAGTRARVCPVPGHPCLDTVAPEEVADAVDRLTERSDDRAPEERTVAV